MKKLLFFSLLIYTLLFSQYSYSQSNKLSFAIFGGYSLPTADLKGTIDGFYSDNYQMKNGFNIGGAAKYDLDKKGYFQAASSIVYNIFYNSNEQVFQGTTLSSKLRMNILSINIGGQYNFMPKKQINPFVNIDLTNNFFSGSTTVSPSANVNNPDSTFTSTSNLKSAYRLGLQLGAGVDIAINDKIGILIGANYDIANLIGKSNDSLSTSTLEYSLNDKDGSMFGTSTPRVISFIQIYTGVSIYLKRGISR